MVNPSGSSLGIDTEYGPLVLSKLIYIAAIILATLSPDVREPTPLEAYLCRALAFALCAFGVLVVILTGSVPLTVISSWLSLTCSHR